MKLFFRIVLVVLTVFFLLLPFQSAQAATPLYVRPGGNDTFCNGTVNIDYSAPVAPNCALAKIQTGINLVDSGGTVNVGAGTYLEAPQINKPLTLRSLAGAASTIINGGDPYSVFISSANVTIDGFTITNPGYTGGSDASGIVVEPLPYGANAHIRITNNIIHDIGAPGRLHVSFGNVGINIGAADGVEIDHNEIYNIIHSDPTAWANGISIWGGDSSTPSGHIVIHNNYFHDISSPFTGDPILVPPAYGDAAISTQTDVGSVVVYDNSIINTPAHPTEYGIEVRSTNAVIADDNWWGSVSGPAGAGLGTGSAITANVFYDPWCAVDCSAPETGLGSAGGNAVRDPWTVIVQPGTIPDGSQVSVVNLDTGRPPITSPMQEMERLVEITIQGPLGPLTSFTPSLEVCYHYSAGDLAAGFDPSQAVIGTAVANGTTWTMLTTQVDAPTNRICAQTTHLSYFEVFFSPTTPITNLPATGFSPGRVTNLPVQTRPYTALGDLWLEIPRLGVQTPIVGVPKSGGGWDVSWLGGSVGWLNGTAFPTWAGNSVLSGHVYDANGRSGPFVQLNGLWYGDQIIIHAWGQEYIYEVRTVQQVDPADTNLITRHEEYPWLTLITCRGYDPASDSYRWRVVVRAVQVDIH